MQNSVRSAAFSTNFCLLFQNIFLLGTILQAHFWFHQNCCHFDHAHLANNKALIKDKVQAEFNRKRCFGVSG